MEFSGVPVGPFVGRAQIEAGYRAQPPTERLNITGWLDDAGADVARFRWSGGGAGIMRLDWRGGHVDRLHVTFTG